MGAYSLRVEVETALGMVRVELWRLSKLSCCVTFETMTLGISGVLNSISDFYSFRLVTV